jgi:hypothetical protein
MSHFTLNSGRQTITKSVVCPTCCQRQEITGAPIVVPASQLACSASCEARYLATLYALCARQPGWPKFKTEHYVRMVADGFTTDLMAQAMANDAR